LHLAALLLEAAFTTLALPPPRPTLPLTEQILALLRRRKRPQHYTGIAQHLGVSPVYIKHQLHKMVKDGRVQWVALGMYALPPGPRP
jgi:predicted transcriptional regulator